MATKTVRINVTNCFLLLLVLALPVLSASAQERTTGAVIFQGVSAFGAAPLLPIYADSLGKTPDLKQQTRLRERTRDYYISRGYLAPAVSVGRHPESDDIVVVRVEEPQIEEIRITGGVAQNRKAMRERMGPLRERTPVSEMDIDRFSRALEQSVGVGLKANTEEISPGYHRVIFAIAPRIDGTLTYSAEGSQRLGQHMVGGSVSVFGPGAGLREVYVSGLHTVDSAGYRNIGSGASLSASDRDTLYFDISASRAVPQDKTASPSRVYRRLSSRLKWRHSLINTRTLALTLDSGVRLRDYTRERGDETQVDEQLRMAEAGARFSVKHGSSTSLAGLSGRMGFNAFGAGRSGTRASDSVDLDFQIIEARYTLWRGLPADFSLRVDIGAQYSTDNLPYSQRFSIGGARFARAYEPGEFSGDSGIGSKFELRRGFKNERWVPAARWVPFAYYGIARAYENESNDSASAAAAGLGLRLLTKQVSAYIEFGKPLTADSVYQSADPRLTGRITTHF